MGVIKTKVTAFSLSSSTVVSREVSSCLRSQLVRFSVQQLDSKDGFGAENLLAGRSFFLALLLIVKLKSIQRRMLTMKSATKGIVTHEMFPFLSSCNQMSPENTRQSPDEVGSAQINSIVRFWTCLDMSGAELE